MSPTEAMNAVAVRERGLAPRTGRVRAGTQPVRASAEAKAKTDRLDTRMPATDQLELARVGDDHAARRIHARTATLPIQAGWPWSGDLTIRVRVTQSALGARALTPTAAPERTGLTRARSTQRSLLTNRRSTVADTRSRLKPVGR
jgi:hypothetical protein